MTTNNSNKYGNLGCGSWSASHFESILTQLKEGNTFTLKSGIGVSHPKWSIDELKMSYRVRYINNDGYAQIWVTNDERRRIIKKIIDTRIG